MYFPQNGRLECNVTECLEEECPGGQVINSPDVCCPLCLNKDCIFENKPRLEGTSFAPSNAKCTNCTCVVSYLN